MAYRLKTVRFQNNDCKVLLQNENGPCPLLAAANALLLKRVISLPPSCIRNGVASLDDVVNILAERALAKDSHEHHLNELMTLFPKLQYGMDVNPKFTMGPTGVEYTSELTAFDMLNVELVHGWLLDPQDSHTVEVLGNKTYNEIIELVVTGKEASLELDKVGQRIAQIDKELVRLRNGPDAGNQDCKEQGEEEEWVDVTKEESDETLAATAMTEAANRADGASDVALNVSEAAARDTDEAAEKDGSEKEKAAAVSHSEQNTPTPEEPMTKEQKIALMERKLDELRTKHKELSTLAHDASLVDSFLNSTSHQLTHYGLHELYNYLKDDTLCVFFRNNHFATLTKHRGVLYLLVTDLGYANVPDVMWEKLDGIDGDTEYVTPEFGRPSKPTELLPSSGPTLSPEQLLAQRGQAESDYQLALELSRHTTTTARNLDEEEGKLVAAATEASLRTYNGMPDEETKTELAATEQNTIAVPPGGIVEGCPTQEVSDQLIAMQLQAQESQEDVSLQLARKLQDEENRRVRPSPRRTEESGATNASKSSGCVIS